MNNNNFYRGNEKLKGSNVTEYVDPETFKWRAQEILRCKRDIPYFAEKYFSIVDLDNGLHIVKLFDCQIRLLKFIQDNLRTVVLASRQTGKTTTYTIFCLWTILFNRDKQILIVANKEETAIEILERIKLAYEEIPNWLQCGIEDGYNKKTIKFANGCKISGDSTSSTSARSKAAGILIIDECAFIDPGIMNKFWASVYPIVSSSNNSKVIMVSTPNGIGNLFYETYNGALLNTKDNSLGWKPVRIDWWERPGRDAKWKEQTIASFNGDMVKFNQEFGNNFHGSSYTLLPEETIAKFKEFVLSKTYFPPKETPFANSKFTYDVWFKPVEGHAYLIGGDVADGIGVDSSIIEVFDITNGRTIIQCAEFSSNQISTIEFTYILAKIGKTYNNAFIAIEANGIGSSVLDLLESVYQYENIINYGRQKRERGIYSHVQSKAQACMWFKDMCKLVDIKVFSKNIIIEMEFFEKKSSKFNLYQAVTGKHDDFMMAFIWAMFCLQEEIIDNYYIVEKYFLTNVGIKLPESVKSYSNKYYAEEANEDIYDVDPDETFRKQLGGGSKATPTEVSTNPDFDYTLDAEDYDEWGDDKEKCWLR